MNFSGLTVNTRDRIDVSGSGELGTCTSPDQPDVTGGTITVAGGRVSGLCWGFGGDDLTLQIAWNNGSYSNFGRAKIDNNVSDYTLQSSPTLEAKGKITEDWDKYTEECRSPTGLRSTTASISELTFSNS
ncbi:hypothetical protein ACIBO4_38530 [Streptomyces sp. NPDC050149]|uniref:hypothetical protein n=1 Tax=Streptomyces sp. NPDC050149 TaxID=3365603 RepID=UPI0037A238A1